MKQSLTVLALFLESMMGASAAVYVSAAPAAERQFLMTHNPADARFLTSIERVGECHVMTPPAVEGLRIPWQVYPKESVDKHEEGSVIVEMVFDAGWCIRKATVIESTGFWRLDNVTLVYLMTVRFTPKPEAIKQKDGEPTMVFRLGWGASQGKHK